MSVRFFVVTSGPGAGKTSLIIELARSGLRTLPDSSRAVIREEMQSGEDALPWADRMAYADRMLERGPRAYQDAQALSGPVIFDRGFPDILLNKVLRPPRAAPRLRSSKGSPLQPSRLPGAVLE
ncbi:AAA family ATPase [Arenibacterium halophilum]|uniref:AAA family ATPase n=1 Tax=Arenibacterium halophilum TaxID=2583821 RepID=UPI001FEBA9EF|nr:AAA family ATPase [Arenibacterium halophilum]